MKERNGCTCFFTQDVQVAENRYLNAMPGTFPLSHCPTLIEELSLIIRTSVNLTQRNLSKSKMKFTLLILFVLSFVLSAHGKPMGRKKPCEKVMKMFGTKCPGNKCFPALLTKKVCGCLPHCVVKLCKKRRGPGPRKESERMVEELGLAEEMSIHMMKKMMMKMKKGPMCPMKCVPDKD